MSFTPLVDAVASGTGNAVAEHAHQTIAAQSTATFKGARHPVRLYATVSLVPFGAVWLGDYHLCRLSSGLPCRRMRSNLLGLNISKIGYGTTTRRLRGDYERTSGVPTAGAAR